MLTKNFYSLIRATMQAVSAPFIKTDGSACENNRTQIASASPPFSTMSSYNAAINSVGVYFGTGTTPAKVTDYCLENPITSGLTVTTPSAATYNRMDEYEEYTVTFGVTAASTVAISEIGLKCTTYSYSSDRNVVLVDRTVLENPIEIPSGQSKQITYTIRFNYPT